MFNSCILAIILEGIYLFILYVQFAKRFYTAQWIRDTQMEKEKALKNPSDLPSDIMERLNTVTSIGEGNIQKLDVLKLKLHKLIDSESINMRYDMIRFFIFFLF